MPRFKPAGTLKADRAVGRRRWLVALIIVAVLIAAGKIYGAVTQRESPVDVLLMKITSPVNQANISNSSSSSNSLPMWGSSVCPTPENPP